MKRTVNLFLLILVLAVAWTAGSAPARAQALAPAVQALYPPEAGELVFVDLQSARRSPHYGRLKEQVLPERYRELERWARQLGVDFDKNVDRLSWAFINTGDPVNSDFVGVAEGTYYLEEVQKVAAASKLRVRAYRSASLYYLGKNEAGREFVFAFPDNARLLFGHSELVEAMLDRSAQGGRSLLDNAEMRALVEQVNRRASIWLVMNDDYTQLGMRQMLGEAFQAPGAETLAQRVRSATVRLALDRNMAATLTAGCASTTDALWFSTFLEGALFFQRQRLNQSNPTLARILSEARIERTGDHISLGVAIPENDMVALLEAHSFSLNF